MFTATEAEHQILDSGAVLVIASGPDAPHAGLPMIDVDDLVTATEGAPHRSTWDRTTSPC
ncbi:hypothetical protein [Aeromicrobium sp. A1-2]|uniref:hypothetical protein n=1 Tax=Aeromicrobium sp. A1-2 TaxID=2107713 RepID=UPI0020B14F63|nr:hypothetical protein [Aeromicrobium sp. A1-2]